MGTVHGRGFPGGQAQTDPRLHLLRWASMTDHCTYPIVTEKEDVIESKQCGKKAIIIFTKDERSYPRCHYHAGTNVVAYATQHGYTMKGIDDPTDPTT
jgi:hypothetical protein